MRVVMQNLAALRYAYNKRLREKPGLKVIVSSGYSTEISLQGVPADAGYVYLPKPSPSAVIAATVRECLEKK